VESRKSAVKSCETASTHLNMQINLVGFPFQVKQQIFHFRSWYWWLAVAGIRIESPCSKLQGIFDRKECGPFMIRPLTPPQAAGNALAFALQKTLMTMTPNATKAIDTYRRGLMRSFKKMTAQITPKTMEVSRSAATGAIGACVIAHSARL